MASPTDTIVAPITAVGGAIAVMRVSGDLAWNVASSVCGTSAEPGVQQYVRYPHGDDGLATLFPASRSYTGEEAAELSCHGSPASVRALLECCIAAGARPAEPGEFTLRAFMNGRLDLTQAEGVRDLVNAQTDAQLRQAGMLRAGRLRSELSALRDTLVGTIAAIEASVDFSDEVGEPDRQGLLSSLGTVSDAVERLLDSGAGARIVREGFVVAIIGRPNAGKSSLFNRVLQSDRAIVTALPGTTRDTLEETLDIHGVTIRLLDTAGLRTASDEAEAMGVARARETAAAADVIWYVFDGSAGWSPEDSAPDRPSILIANKSDLPRLGDQPAEVLSVSASTGEGVSELLATTVDLAGNSGSTGLVNQRHAPLLQEALEAIGEAEAALASE
ncbi:MAG: tRNA uridine-5-carboxymethylaminomethyl(34) synthesis GTPase MnmE, partial [Fimbriimonadaceae bacterium]